MKAENFEIRRFEGSVIRKIHRNNAIKVEKIKLRY